MPPPTPTLLFRLMHIDNLELCHHRGGLHAPNHCPNDGRTYRTIHDVQVQQQRTVRTIHCGPGGVIHDYVPFYFGYLSPMLLQLHTGRVAGYTEGQEPLLYLVTTAQDIQIARLQFVFSDGHGLATYTDWFDTLERLDAVDWNMVFQRYWSDQSDDMDRQRRKQAEFLIHRFCPWAAIREIGVFNEAVRERVQATLDEGSQEMQKPVVVRRNWYY
jgi:hypothetical protein